MKKSQQALLFLLSVLFTANTYASDTARVLFIGNSYTAVNNLPQLLTTLAASAGDVVITDANIPGGTTLKNHSTNPTTLSKIALGTWDYVVLQEQSQIPSFPDAQVDMDMYPYAKILDSLIRKANICTETVFYMTWGRKNGDASNCTFFPPVCTYSGMDSLLRLRYQTLADTNDAILSPVGAVWRKLRNTNPTINLYDADESHPSLAGSYAAACAFYATLFSKNPTTITANAGLPPADAAAIRAAAKAVVYDSLQYWKIGTYTFPIWCAGTTTVADHNTLPTDIKTYIQGNTLHLTTTTPLAPGTHIALINTQGKTIATHPTTNPAQRFTLPLPHVASGIYFISITTATGQRVVKKIFLP
ncbi:MAG TPA: T9SS type A sorting domain-containing protein [Flavipsychrobacter sp.]|nr:T9SS type A sorting domain-containing protein [Flavipsychrobacter sp.]